MSKKEKTAPTKSTCPAGCPEITEHKQSRDGPAIWNRVTHAMRFNRAVTLDEVKKAVAAEKWYGYNPAGYGPWAFRRDNKIGTRWLGTHSASCD